MYLRTSTLQATVNMGGQGRDGGKAKPLKVRAPPSPSDARATDTPDQAPKKEKKELDEEDKAFMEKKRAGKDRSDPAVWRACADYVRQMKRPRRISRPRPEARALW